MRLLTFTLCTAAAVAITFTACRKEQSTPSGDEAKKTTSVSQPQSSPTLHLRRTGDPIIDIRIRVYDGKRKTDDPNTPGPCDGKSICFVVGNGAPSSDPYSDQNDWFNAHLARDTETGKLYLQVDDSEISTYSAGQLFGTGTFNQDVDFTFPSATASAIGLTSVSILEGDYTVTHKDGWYEVELN